MDARLQADRHTFDITLHMPEHSLCSLSCQKVSACQKSASRGLTRALQQQGDDVLHIKTAWLGSGSLQASSAQVYYRTSAKQCWRASVTPGFMQALAIYCVTDKLKRKQARPTTSQRHHTGKSHHVSMGMQAWWELLGILVDGRIVVPALPRAVIAVSNEHINAKSSGKPGQRRCPCNCQESARLAVGTADSV